MYGPEKGRLRHVKGLSVPIFVRCLEVKLPIKTQTPFKKVSISFNNLTKGWISIGLSGYCHR